MRVRRERRTTNIDYEQGENLDRVDDPGQRNGTDRTRPRRDKVIGPAARHQDAMRLAHLRHRGEISASLRLRRDADEEVARSLLAATLARFSHGQAHHDIGPPDPGGRLAVYVDLSGYTRTRSVNHRREFIRVSDRQ